MSKQDISRAWKDEEYRNSLSEEQRSQLPENPAGMIEMSNDEMESVAGGLLNNVMNCGTHHVCPTKESGCPTKNVACPQPSTLLVGCTNGKLQMW